MRYGSAGKKRLSVVWYLAGVCTLLLLLYFGYDLFCSNRLTVNHVYVKQGGLSSALRGKAALQITDIHMKGIGDMEHDVLKVIEAQKPDLLFLTGDYIEWNGDYKSALDFLSRLNAPDRAWAVMGDYDYSNSRKSCLFCHDKGSGKPSTGHVVKFLKDACDQAVFGMDSILICGVDGVRVGELLVPDAGKRLQEKATGRAAIVLSHSPLVFDLIDDNQDVFILAGDTHGGQIPLPKWFWKLLRYEKMKYEQGWFEEGKKKMYVSRGLGTSHFPIRLFRRPEITMFHFE